MRVKLHLSVSSAHRGHPAVNRWKLLLASKTKRQGTLEKQEPEKLERSKHPALAAIVERLIEKLKTTNPAPRP
jgi:hypothetical protein